MDIVKTEYLLRISAISLLVLTACLVGFDAQTKLIFHSFHRTASFRDMNALVVLVWVDSVAAGYNLLHLLAGTSICSRIKRNNNPVKVSHPYLAWVCFLLDQATVYVVFAANSAATEASFLAVTGSNDRKHISTTPPTLDQLHVHNRNLRRLLKHVFILFCWSVVEALYAVL
ncbi:hypothetical protein Vadar_001006 [Vaccinium darrowii]|uniref:Uncharacterized protein n=1 Tax=Vaccinium darrowii TaxID=229202 RepID=A0ACB7YJE4_9ERIC|nr:hypothetical protein Vadar_001006 [Vaccinium darrowii]